MAEESERKSLEFSKDEYLGNIIRAFHPLLLEKLRVSHTLCHLHIEEVRNVAPSINKKEDNGQEREAASDLLEAIGKGREPGKWRMFIDALKEVRDTVILDILLEEGKGENEGHQDWLQQCQTLIEIFSKPIIDHLNLGDLLPKMYQKDLIIKNDMERLGALIKDGKKRDAITSFLFILHRHNSDWFDIFITILLEDECHQELAKEILGDIVFDKRLKIIYGESTTVTPADRGSTHALRHDLSASEAHRPDGKKERSTNFASLSEKDVGDKSLPNAANVQTAARARSYPPSAHAQHEGSPTKATSSCGCGCCQEVLTFVTATNQELSNLKSEVALLTSELQDMKDLLLKALKLNSFGH